jgi:hypothetical protein
MSSIEIQQVDPDAAENTRMPAARGSGLALAPVAHVEVIETGQYEEPIGEEVRVIDNRQSAAGVVRNIKVSREWTRTVSIAAERATVNGASLAVGPAWLNVKGSVEQQLHHTYSAEEQSTHVFAEELTLTVPESSRVRLVLAWKRIWQRGIVKVAQDDGTIYQVPYQVVVNVTFDQSQHDD